ncbi:MAG: glycosyltransferase [Clostridia bacterium]|nr:glycosyltransferase [Clostridia bacterium]
MKILLASDSYSFTTSGVSNVVITLADGLRRQGHDVKVLTLADGRNTYQDGDDFYIRSYPTFLSPEIRFTLSRTDPILEEIVRWKPDLIHLHTEGSIARMVHTIASRTKTPVIMTAHTDYAYYVFGRFESARPVYALMKTLGKKVYKNVAEVTVPSDKARSFPQLQPAADRIVLVPNGIKLEQYQKPVSAQEKAAMFERYGLKDNGCTLVMITRVSREKNIMEILKYMPTLLKELPKAQLMIVGDGPDRKRLEKFCRTGELMEHVVFAGRIPADEVYRYYAMGDVFVSASVFEVHSMSYLEAMSCGLPLVCREDDSLKGVLEDGENGFIYRTESEFVHSIARIVNDRALRETMRTNARKKAEAFSEQRFVDHMLEQYEKVAKEREDMR